VCCRCLTHRMNKYGSVAYTLTMRPINVVSIYNSPSSWLYVHLTSALLCPGACLVAIANPQNTCSVLLMLLLSRNDGGKHLCELGGSPAGEWDTPVCCSWWNCRNIAHHVGRLCWIDITL
jgi:hypothetical protein